jgi:hypothetical protein
MTLLYWARYGFLLLFAVIVIYFIAAHLLSSDRTD